MCSADSCDNIMWCAMTNATSVVPDSVQQIVPMCLRFCMQHRWHCAHSAYTKQKCVGCQKMFLMLLSVWWCIWNNMHWDYFFYEKRDCCPNDFRGCIHPSAQATVSVSIIDWVIWITIIYFLWTARQMRNNYQKRSTETMRHSSNVSAASEPATTVSVDLKKY